MLLTILSVLIGAIVVIALFLSAVAMCTLVLCSGNKETDPKAEWGFAKFAFSSYVVGFAAFCLLILVILVGGGA